MDVNILGHGKVHELTAKMFSGKNVMRRHDTILHNALLMIDVVQEEVQCGDALHETSLDVFPLLGWNDARYKVERENPLCPARVAIDIERHALT